MTDLIKLNDIDHRNLKVSADSYMELAKKSHVINLTVAEVGKAVSSFPVFLSKNAQTGDWALSALSSFKQGHNLFVENGKWIATHQPTCIQTFPFCLIPSEEDAEKLSVGFDSSNKSFSEQQGEALYGDDGKPSDFLQKITTLLEADLQYGAQTYHFNRKLEELGLIKAIDIIVSYAGGSTHTLKGLHTLDEDKIKLLDTETLVEFNKNGYLTVIHAMLTSIYQLNTMIKMQSSRTDMDPISQIKLEVSRDALVE